MKKIAMLLLVGLLGSVCFADHDIDFAKREFDRQKRLEMNRSSLCVRRAAKELKEVKKEFSFGTQAGGIELLETKINMGTYSLFFTAKEGKLMAFAQLHEGETSFPKHCVHFYQENIVSVDATVKDGAVDMHPKYHIKMDLMPQTSYDAFSTYTIGYAW